LQAVAGIPSEDDDGNAASKPAKKAEEPAPLTDIDKQWIKAAKADPSVLSQLDSDPAYKAQIKEFMK
jgi:hypothetical protein